MGRSGHGAQPALTLDPVGGVGPASMTHLRFTVRDVGKRSRAISERRSDREAQQRADDRLRRTAATRGCLFCRRSDGGFTSREHVFPESIGNQELVLPPGVVGDRCNNTTLSKLDGSLCEFSPRGIRRTMLGVPSKAGKVPTFRFSEGTIEYRAPTRGGQPGLVFTARPGKEILREVDRLPNGQIKLEWNGSGGRRLTPRYASELSRSILKMALECAWIDHGPAMLESRFDHVRAAVLGERRNGCLIVGNRLNPTSNDGSLTYQFIQHQGAWRVMAWVQLLGLYLGTDSRLPTPLAAVPDSMTSITFTAADCRG